MPEAVHDELLAHAGLLEQFGPHLKRPRVDTFNGAKHANMRELRFDAADGGILLVAGDKSGRSEKRFYRELITKADRRFAEHLAELQSKGGR